MQTMVEKIGGLSAACKALGWQGGTVHQAEAALVALTCRKCGKMHKLCILDAGSKREKQRLCPDCYAEVQRKAQWL